MLVIKQDGEYKLGDTISANALNVSVYNSNGILFVAQYDGNELAKVNLAADGIINNEEISDATDKVKVMCFDAKDKISPLCKASEFTVVR